MPAPRSARLCPGWNPGHLPGYPTKAVARLTLDDEPEEGDFESLYAAIIPEPDWYPVRKSSRHGARKPRREH
jgi:hypothetical protein